MLVNFLWPRPGSIINPSLSALPNIPDLGPLGNIPIFGNLFRHRSVSTNTQELIFFITPRIIQT